MCAAALIFEYLIDEYGPHLAPPKEDKDAYLRYKYWLHYAEGTILRSLHGLDRPCTTHTSKSKRRSSHLDEVLTVYCCWVASSALALLRISSADIDEAAETYAMHPIQPHLCLSHRQNTII